MHFFTCQSKVRRSISPPMVFILILIVMNFFYAGSPTFMKLALQELHPFQIVFLRHTLALLAFLPLFLLQPKKRIDRNDFFKIMLGSLLAFTFASTFQIIGMQYSLATDGSFIMSMEPILVILLAYFFLNEKLEYKMFGGLALGVIGFVVLSNYSLESKMVFNGRWFGNLLFLLATMAEASFPIFLKPLLKKYSPLVVAFYSLLCASFYMLPLQTAGLWKNISSLSPQAIFPVIYLGLGCSFLACLLWLVCLKRATASLVAISWFIQPVFGCLFAFFLLKEPITANIWVGGTFILAALTLLTTKTVAPEPAVPEPLVPVQTLVRIQHPLWEMKMLDHRPEKKLTHKIPSITSLLGSHHRHQHRPGHVYH